MENGNGQETRNGEGQTGSTASQRAASEATPAPPGEDEVILAVCAYVPVLCLVPALVGQESDYIRAHARQGVSLFFIEIVAAMAWFVPVLGPFLFGATLVLLLVALPMAIKRAWHGETWVLPVAGKMAHWIGLLSGP